MYFNSTEMKYLLLILSFVTMILFGVKASACGFDAEMDNVSTQQVSVDVNGSKSLKEVVSAPSCNRSLGDMVFMDTQSFARQVYGSSCRVSRTTTPYYISYHKSLMRLMALRMELLSQGASQFSTMPCFGWAIPADYYVFGMRRILI